MEPEKKPGALAGCLTLIVLGVLVVVCVNVVGGKKQEVAAPPPPAPVQKPHVFAEPGIKVTSLLGQSRARVHALLGKPLDSGVEGELFKKGDVALAARHYEKGRLVWLSATYASAGESFQAPELLKWLKVDPQLDKVVVGSATYNVTSGEGAVLFIEARYAAAKARREAAKAEQENAKQQKAVRQSIASKVEEGFLKQGMDAYVRVRGNSLVIYGISCTRATLYQLVNGDGEGWFSEIKHASFRQTLKGAGFKYLRCVDPYNGGEGWSEL